MDTDKRPADAPSARSRWLHWKIGPARTLLVATVALSLVFFIFSGLDIWFSRQFYDAKIGFAAQRIPALQWLRDLAAILIWLIVGALAISLLVKLIRPGKPSPIAPVKSLFLFSTLVIGPGILVNGIFKAFWGRPRPIAIEEFGGEFPFVEAWRISGYCDSNCSFVSGEASTAIWLIALALVVPLAWRSRVAIVALVLAVMFSLNRVAFGGHFLSDVLLSWTMTLLVIVGVHHFLFVRPIPALANDRLERGLTRAGRWLHGLVGRGRDAASGTAAPTDGDDDGTTDR